MIKVSNRVYGTPVFQPEKMSLLIKIDDNLGCTQVYPLVALPCKAGPALKMEASVGLCLQRSTWHLCGPLSTARAVKALRKSLHCSSAFMAFPGLPSNSTNSRTSLSKMHLRELFSNRSRNVAREQSDQEVSPELPRDELMI